MPPRAKQSSKHSTKSGSKPGTRQSNKEQESSHQSPADPPKLVFSAYHSRTQALVQDWLRTSQKWSAKLTSDLIPSLKHVVSLMNDANSNIKLVDKAAPLLTTSEAERHALHAVQSLASDMGAALARVNSIAHKLSSYAADLASTADSFDRLVVDATRTRGYDFAFSSPLFATWPPASFCEQVSADIKRTLRVHTMVLEAIDVVSSSANALYDPKETVFMKHEKNTPLSAYLSLIAAHSTPPGRDDLREMVAVELDLGAA